MENLRYRFPEEAGPMWKAVLRVVAGFETLPMEAARPEIVWPVLALAKRIGSLARSIAVLASERCWADSIVLLRVTVEAQLLIEWMLRDPDKRCRAYVAGIQDEEARLSKKLNSSGAITFQILSDLGLLETDPQSGPQSTASDRRPDLRTVACQAGDEASYDTAYWIASVYVHNHPLSLMKYCHSFVKVDRALSGFFEEEFLSYLVIYGSVTCILHALQTVNEQLDLSLESGIALAWDRFHEAMVKGSGGILKYDSEMNPDDMIVGKRSIRSGDETAQGQSETSLDVPSCQRFTAPHGYGLQCSHEPLGMHIQHCPEVPFRSAVTLHWLCRLLPTALAGDLGVHCIRRQIDLTGPRDSAAINEDLFEKVHIR